MNHSPTGESEPLDLTRHLLVLDYPGRRPEARIRELDLGRYGYRSSELITATPPEEVTARRYAERILAGTHAAGSGAGAILGYCAAAALGQECARILVAEGGDPLPLVLFNASPVTVRDVQEFYQSALRGLSPGPGSGTRAVVDVERLVSTPQMLLDAVRTDLTARTRMALADAGYAKNDTSALITQAVKVHTDWLCHLLAAHHHTSPDWGGRVLHVVSRDHSYREAWPGARSTCTVEIDCDRTILLRCEETRATVLSFLAEVGAPGLPETPRGKSEAR